LGAEATPNPHSYIGSMARDWVRRRFSGHGLMPRRVPRGPFGPDRAAGVGCVRCCRSHRCSRTAVRSAVLVGQVERAWIHAGPRLSVAKKASTTASAAGDGPEGLVELEVGDAFGEGQRRVDRAAEVLSTLTEVSVDHRHLSAVGRSCGDGSDPRVHGEETVRTVLQTMDEREELGYGTAHTAFQMKTALSNRVPSSRRSKRSLSSTRIGGRWTKRRWPHRGYLDPCVRHARGVA
jgi:hypothetical protein